MILDTLIIDATMVTMDERRHVLEGSWWQRYHNEAVEKLLHTAQSTADSSYF
jgi:hypothetical protein